MKKFETPEQVLKEWLDGVNAGKVEEVLSLYDKKTVLLPTFSNKTLSTPEGIRSYFNGLANRKNLKVILHEKPFFAVKIGPSLYSMTGIYCWKMEVDEEVLSFEARFTYTVDLELEAPIVHHHSSQVPRTL